MQDATERLACYDKLFESSGQPARQSSTRTPTTIQDLGLPSTRPSTQAETPSSVTSPGFGLTKEPSKDEKRGLTQIDSRVDSITRRAHNEMVFHLENEQIWAQTSVRYVTIKEGDEVVVRKLRMGGYVLTNERGASTRVARLR